MIVPGQLHPGTFINRVSRFSATVVVGGGKALAYVPNSGRLAELLVPGAPVLVRRPAPSGDRRRTGYDLLFVAGPTGWVCVQASLAGPLFVEAFRTGILTPPEGADPAAAHIVPEVAVGGNRIDFQVTCGNRSYLVECKSVTLVDHGVALFPDAPTARGLRQVRELGGQISPSRGAWVIFVVMREDADAFRPNRACHPEFAQVLEEAHAAGVRVASLTCRVLPPEIRPHKAIPVLLAAS